MTSAEITTPAARKAGKFACWAGNILSLVAVASYFTIVPRWPDLRDSGLPNMLAAAGGFVLSLAGFLRIRRGCSRWWALGPGLAFLVTAFLGFYIYHLSYQLPPADGVIPVGSRAPAFRLRDQDDRERSIEDWAGRRVVLVFFRGHW